VQADGDFPGIQADAEAIAARYCYDPAREAILRRGGKHTEAEEKSEQGQGGTEIPARHGGFLS
jgi:hypothetical protein